MLESALNSLSRNVTSISCPIRCSTVSRANKALTSGSSGSGVAAFPITIGALRLTSRISVSSSASANVDHRLPKASATRSPGFFLDRRQFKVLFSHTFFRRQPQYLDQHFADQRRFVFCVTLRPRLTLDLDKRPVDLRA